jgi:hypothetical protein
MRARKDESAFTDLLERTRDLIGWPLTASEYLTLSPVESRQKIEQEHQKPSLKKLDALYQMRMRLALADAPDLDAYFQLRDEAEREWAKPQVSAYRTLLPIFDTLENKNQNRLTSANLKRNTRQGAWQALAINKAEKELTKPGIHRRSAVQLAIKLCGIDVWNPEAQFKFVFMKGKIRKKAHVSADRLSRFLGTRYSFPRSK